MSKKRSSLIFVAIWVCASWVIGMGGCSTTGSDGGSSPGSPTGPTVPDYVQVPHPEGFNLADLNAIFTDKTVPSDEMLKSCDTDFKKLLTLTTSLDEIREGSLEFVRQNPIKYHWCFYSKLQQLEGDLKASDYVDERQKLVLDRFRFLTPIARAFMDQYHDTRYMRWAVFRYRQISEWVFYRRMELSIKGTDELVEATNPFGPWRDAGGPVPVLDKYHLNKDDWPLNPIAQAASSTSSPQAQSSGQPLASASPLPGAPVEPQPQAQASSAPTSPATMPLATASTLPAPATAAISVESSAPSGFGSPLPTATNLNSVQAIQKGPAPASVGIVPNESTSAMVPQPQP